MASVDNRIVNMTFNNAEFESRVASTIKSLQSLDKTIAEVGGKSGLDKLNTEANKFNLDGMSSAIEGVSAKFLALSTIGITALANLTNKAIDAGISIAKSLAIEPISSGFSEYEQKLGAIQTIMAGSGADLETVNRKLQELNEYSDKTIYSFSDMTQNIGKFTNAGVDLDTSVAAIQGVAQVAALSGANAEEASRAMYNFGQALGKGSVQAIDWKSIDLANMGTVEFKQQLIDGAEAMGVLTKQGDHWVTKSGEIVNTAGAFQESLKENWLTTDVLTGTLAKYADETTEIGKRAFAASSDIKTFSQMMDVTKETVGSGWAESFEIIFGGFEDAKHLWGAVGGAIGDFVNESSDKRNKFLSDWKNLGGQMELFAGLYLAFQNLKDVVKPVIEAFREIFPPMTAERAYELSKSFRELMEGLKPSETTITNIGRIFKGLFNVLDVGWEILKAGIGVIKDFVGSLAGASSGGILEFFAGIGDALASLDAEKIVGGLETAFGKLQDIFRNPLPYIMEFVEKIKTAFGELTDLFRNPMPGIEEFVGKIGEFFSGLSVKIPDIGGPLSGAVEKIKEVFGGLGDILSGVSLPDIDFGSILSSIGGVFTQIIDKITGFFSSGGEMATTVGEAAGGVDWETVMAAVGIGMVGGLIATVNRLITNGINIDFTGGILSSISDTFGQLTGVLKTMQQDIKSNIILKIAAAIGVLAIAVLALSFIDAGDLAKSMTAIAAGFGQLIGAMALLNKIDFSTSDAAKFTLMAFSFTLLSGSLVLLAIAMKIFATMSWEDMAKGGAAFTAVVGAIILMSKFIENQAQGMVKSAFAMLMMALSMGAMAKAISKFGEMDTAVLVQGMIGLAAAMGLLVGTMNLLPDDMQKKTAGLAGFSIALNLMVFAIKQLGQMDLGQLVQGGVAFAIMLGGLVIALNKMPANMAVQAAQLLGLAGAMLIMGIALKVFASMSWPDMIQGLVGMAGALIILVAAMVVAEGGIIGAGAILIMSVALLVLAAAVKAFAAIGFADFAKGMILMAAAIAILAGVAFLLQPALPALLIMGIALAAIGLGVAGLGFGLAQVAKGLAILAKIGPEGAKGIVAVMKAIGQGIPALFTGVAEGIGQFVEVLIGFIPIFIEFAVKLLTALLEGFTTMMPAIFAFIEVLIQGILDLLVFYIPAMVDAGLQIIIGLLEGIRAALPEIVVLVAEIIAGFLNALAESLPLIIEAGLNLLLALIQGVTQEIGFIADAVVLLITEFIKQVGESVGEIVDAGVQVLTDFLSGISDNLSLIIDTVGQMITQFITDVGSFVNDIIDAGVKVLTDFLSGLSDNLSLIIDTVTSVITQFITDVGSMATSIAQAGTDALVDFLEGMSDNVSKVISTVTTIIVAFIREIGNSASVIVRAGFDTLLDFLEGLATDTVEFVDACFVIVTNFLNGLAEVIRNRSDELAAAGRNLRDAVMDGVKENVAGLAWDIGLSIGGGLVGGALNAILAHSPSKVFMDIGGYVMQGLAIGINDGMKEAIAPFDEFTSTAESKFSETVAAITSHMDNLGALNPVITPVLDLTNIVAGSSAIDGMLGNKSYATAGVIASSQQTSTDETPVPGVTEIKFEQTINAPTQLSTADIYRQTRNQITLAKEELSIP